jgi:cytochrome c556
MVIVSGIIYMHKDQVSLIKIPPKSLAQWYKPENKRQVWLHNMFKLRREMQALRFYSQAKEAKKLQKWLNQFSEHYLKIFEMVPEWNKKLDREALATLQNFAQVSNFQGITKVLDSLDESCKLCHTDYRAITATMYRAPDFSKIEKLSSSASIQEHMKTLIKQINQVKIASEDGMPDHALSSLSDLSKGLELLGESCSGCHKKDRKIYPSDSMSQTLARLKQSIKFGTQKKQGEELGSLAVQACARCHATHRLSADSRKLFLEPQSLSELIRH